MPDVQPRRAFGRRIQDLRRDLRLTQPKLVELLNARGHTLDAPYLSRIENGRVLPTEAVIRSLAEILGANADELLDLAGQLDPRALQDKAAELPKVGALLRRIQSGKMPREMLDRLLAEIDGADDEAASADADNGE